jgi:CheY-like chemotaxis protein
VNEGRSLSLLFHQTVHICFAAGGRGLASKKLAWNRRDVTVGINDAIGRTSKRNRKRTKVGEVMPSKKILLVDDSETILQMEQLFLRDEPYELIVARDGAEGVAKALDTHPDLILMDVVMPKMDGFEAVKQLRDNSKTSQVPIVMVTTQSEAESMETGYLNGCSDYIVKPIDGTELLSKVKSLLGE